MRGRGFLWALVGGSLLVVAVLWGVIFALDYQPQLGLDLRGGISITLSPSTQYRVEQVEQEFDTEELEDAVSEHVPGSASVARLAGPQRDGVGVVVTTPATDGDSEAQQAIVAEIAQMTGVDPGEVARPSDVQEADLRDAVDVLRSRVDALGVAEPELARRGNNIMVQLPGLENQGQAEDVIERTASLQFRRVRDIVYPPQHPNAGLYQRGPEAPGYQEIGPSCEQIEQRLVQQGPPPADEEVVLCGVGEQGGQNGEDGQGGGEAAQGEGDDVPPPKYVLGPTVIEGEAIEDASARLNQSGTWQTQLQLDDQGGETFADITAELACAPPGSIDRQFAIVLDGQVRAFPVSERVECDVGIQGGSAVIDTGSQAQAEEIATVLRGGSLPIQLSITQSEAVSPTLGAESLQGGLQAGFLGLALVAGYLILLYRGIGVLAVLELAMFAVVVYGLIIVLGNTIGFTLTLAGIAGVVVSVGIAADSSIIYRERYRDEIRAGATVRSAADKAFTRAFRTNLTGNTVSFLAAVVLYLLAIGPVRGFAFTLGLSTLVDTLLLATFTRGLFGLVSRNKHLARSRWMGLRARTVAPRLAPAGGAGPAHATSGDGAASQGDSSGTPGRGAGSSSHETDAERES